MNKTLKTDPPKRLGEAIRSLIRSRDVTKGTGASFHFLALGMVTNDLNLKVHLNDNVC